MEYWSDHRDFLFQRGYSLPDHPEMLARTNLMNAVRRSDQSRVMFKWVSTSIYSNEVEIAQFLGCGSQRPENHCIPILEPALDDPDDPDKKLLVMPLCVDISAPRFETVGEVLDCIRQMLEGIEYMHQNFVAHSRDCNWTNFVQVPKGLYPDDFNPAKPWMALLRATSKLKSRTECWPRYHIIDFGLSRRYDPSNGPPLEDVILGGDKSPPEHFRSACNPFPTDIYFLGNNLEALAKGTLGDTMPLPSLEFLTPLIVQMNQDDPASRPTIGEALSQFDSLCATLTVQHLRRSVRPLSLIQHLTHRLQQWKRARNNIPAMPAHIPTTSPPLSENLRRFYTYR
ncbi:hypothetical protein C8R46DRAFT_985174 [Mycena filopes]|nr:hypothetical protein C8R46DRAFT_985174 [Mycena filopes]